VKKPELTVERLSLKEPVDQEPVALRGSETPESESQ